MNYLYSRINTLRDRYSAVRHESNFRQSGEITPMEFVLAGDYLVSKFPTWSWSDAEPTSLRVNHLPPGKQFLVTRNVPCSRRWNNEDFAGDAGRLETLVGDGADFRDGAAPKADDDDGWLRTGGVDDSQILKMKQVREVDDGGNVGDTVVIDDDDEIPNMEEEDDEEAIIRDGGAASERSGRRTYSLYITYSPFYRTPRFFLSGYLRSGQPLTPELMMDDVVGDYKDKTVTVEDFPFFDGKVKMASVHPCKHAPVMKTLLDRADAALRRRRDRELEKGAADTGGEGAGKRKSAGVLGFLVDEITQLDEQDVRKIHAEAKEVEGGADHDFDGGADHSSTTNSGGDPDRGHGGGPGAAPGGAPGGSDEWEEIKRADPAGEVAIRADQYLVVFLKFMASVTPGIEHDFTMGL